MIDPNDDRTQNEKDMAMLIKQLVRRIRRDIPNDPLCEKALDYLVRKNLVRLTDCLR